MWEGSEGGPGGGPPCTVCVLSGLGGVGAAGASEVCGGGLGAREGEFLLLPIGLQLTLPSAVWETYWEGDKERRAIAGSTAAVLGLPGAEGMAKKLNLITWEFARALAPGPTRGRLPKRTGGDGWVNRTNTNLKARDRKQTETWTETNKERDTGQRKRKNRVGGPQEQDKWQVENPESDLSQNGYGQDEFSDIL